MYFCHVPFWACLLTSISPVSETLEDITPSTESLYTTTVIIHSTKESAILPLNVSIGNIRPVLSTDTNVLEDAADFTASQVANQWYSLVSAMHAARSNIDDLPTLVSDKIVNGGHAIHNSNLQEMAQDNLDFVSSILSPYLKCTERHQANSFSPIGNSNIQPHSEECFGKLLHALECAIVCTCAA